MGFQALLIPAARGAVKKGIPGGGCPVNLICDLLSHNEADSDLNFFAGGLF